MSPARARRTAGLLAIAALAMLAAGWWFTAIRDKADAAALTAAARPKSPRAAPAAADRQPSAGRPAGAGAEQVADIAEQACGRARRGQLRRLRSRLRVDASADEAVARALLLLWARAPGELAGDPGALARELDAASRRWPDDLALAGLNATYCETGYGCDPVRAMQHLVDLDPDNAATWLVVMEHAQQRGDMRTLHAALQRAATVTGYDAGFGRAYLAVRPFLDALPPPAAACTSPAWLASVEAEIGQPPSPSDLSDLMALSLELATSLPTFAALSRACTPSAIPLPPARRQDCIAVTSKLAAGDTMIERSIGLRLRVRLAGDDADSRTWRERYRRFLWMRDQIGRGPRPPDPVRAMLSAGEVPTWEAFLAQDGRWPPPAGWLPADAGARSLVLAGTVPDGPD